MRRKDYGKLNTVTVEEAVETNSKDFIEIRINRRIVKRILQIVAYVVALLLAANIMDIISVYIKEYGFTLRAILAILTFMAMMFIVSLVAHDIGSED